VLDLKFTYRGRGGLKKLKETSFRKQIKSVQKKKKKMMRKMLKRKFFSVIVKGVLEGEKGKLKLFFVTKKLGRWERIMCAVWSRKVHRYV
jgi:hypothetical protein